MNFFKWLWPWKRKPVIICVRSSHPPDQDVIFPMELAKQMAAIRIATEAIHQAEKLNEETK